MTALPVSQLDVFNAALVGTLGFGGSPATPETLGETLKKVDLRDFAGTSFSPEMEGEAMEAAPGREFLTWLWFKAETQNGRMALAAGGEIGVLLEGPLTFTHEGNGAHAAVLKKGMPENSIEAKTCLLSGKKLKEAKITFALDEQLTWSFGFEADQFLIRGLKLPQGEEPVGCHQPVPGADDFPGAVAGDLPGPVRGVSGGADGCEKVEKGDGGYPGVDPRAAGAAIAGCVGSTSGMVGDKNRTAGRHTFAETG